MGLEDGRALGHLEEEEVSLRDTVGAGTLGLRFVTLDILLTPEKKLNPNETELFKVGPGPLRLPNPGTWVQSGGRPGQPLPWCRVPSPGTQPFRLQKHLFQAQKDHPHVCPRIYIHTAKVYKVRLLPVTQPCLLTQVVGVERGRSHPSLNLPMTLSGVQAAAALGDKRK